MSDVSGLCYSEVGDITLDLSFPSVTRVMEQMIEVICQEGNGSDKEPKDGETTKANVMLHPTSVRQQCSGQEMNVQSQLRSGQELNTQSHLCFGQELNTQSHLYSDQELSTPNHLCSGQELNTQSHLCFGQELSTQSHVCSGQELNTQRHFCSGQVLNSQSYLCSGKKMDTQSHICSCQELNVQSHLCSGQESNTQTHSCSGQELNTQSHLYSGQVLNIQSHICSGQEMNTQSHLILGQKQNAQSNSSFSTAFTSHDQRTGTEVHGTCDELAVLADEDLLNLTLSDDPNCSDRIPFSCPTLNNGRDGMLDIVKCNIMFLDDMQILKTAIKRKQILHDPLPSSGTTNHSRRPTVADTQCEEMYTSDLQHVTVTNTVPEKRRSSQCCTFLHGPKSNKTPGFAKQNVLLEVESGNRPSLGFERADSFVKKGDNSGRDDLRPTNVGFIVNHDCSSKDYQKEHEENETHQNSQADPNGKIITDTTPDVAQSARVLGPRPACLDKQGCLDYADQGISAEHPTVELGERKFSFIAASGDSLQSSVGRFVPCEQGPAHDLNPMKIPVYPATQTAKQIEAHERHANGCITNREVLHSSEDVRLESLDSVVRPTAARSTDEDVTNTETENKKMHPQNELSCLASDTKDGSDVVRGFCTKTAKENLNRISKVQDQSTAPCDHRHCENDTDSVVSRGKEHQAEKQESLKKGTIYFVKETGNVDMATEDGTNAKHLQQHGITKEDPESMPPPCKLGNSVPQRVPNIELDCQVTSQKKGVIQPEHSFPRDDRIEAACDQLVPDKSKFDPDKICSEHDGPLTPVHVEDSFYATDEGKDKFLPSPNFKWKYRPSCDTDGEGITSLEDAEPILGYIQPLMTRLCSRSLRIGLSRKQKVKRLHKQMSDS